MKLIAEQIKKLRERREELLLKKEEFNYYLRNREKDSIEGFGSPVYLDHQSSMEYHNLLEEIAQIDHVLGNAQFITKRNYNKIDIGTGFYIRFGEEENAEKITLVEESFYHPSSEMVSLESDFGKAVFGTKKGDSVTYKVQATGRMITFSVEDIDSMENHYEHFIREKSRDYRICKGAKKELHTLKENESEEYQKWKELTASQFNLLEEELGKLSETSNDPVVIARRKVLNQILYSSIAKVPNDDTIGVGSRVHILLTDENGNVVEKKFEYINQAVSTELGSHYVERISTLGMSLFGLRAGDSFQVKRNHLPSLKGMVLSVDNDYSNKIQRVR